MENSYGWLNQPLFTLYYADLESYNETIYLLHYSYFFL